MLICPTASQTGEDQAAHTQFLAQPPSPRPRGMLKGHPTGIASLRCFVWHNKMSIRMSHYLLIASCAPSELVLGFHAYGSSRIVIAVSESRPRWTVWPSTASQSIPALTSALSPAHRFGEQVRQWRIGHRCASPCTVDTAKHFLRVSPDYAAADPM